MLRIVGTAKKKKHCEQKYQLEEEFLFHFGFFTLDTVLLQSSTAELFPS